MSSLADGFLASIFLSAFSKADFCLGLMFFSSLASCFLSRAAAQLAQVHLQPAAGFSGLQPQPHALHIILPFSCVEQLGQLRQFSLGFQLL